MLRYMQRAPVRAAGSAPGGRKAVSDGEGAQAQVLNSHNFEIEFVKSLSRANVI